MSTSLAGKTLFLACGGTGGHIFPAFAVAEELAGRHPDLNIRYICGDKDIESKIFATIPKNRFDVIRSAPFRGVRSFADPSFLLKLIQGIRSARELLASGKPDLVVGFGGYLSFPLVWMAGGMKIKTLIHEQNVVPGTANRLLSGRVDAAALSSEATRKALTRCRRTVVTGNPIRPMIERDCAREALDLFGFDPDRLTILVLGGSQGAESINTIFLGALRFIGKQYRRKIQVLHLCGRMATEQAERSAEEAGVKSRAFSFFDRMDLVYSLADFAIGRAGATFLAEIAARDIPAILIPYPFGNGHQLDNAREFERLSDATVIEQEDLEVAEFAEQVERYIVRLDQKRSGSALVEQVPAKKLSRQYRCESNARQKLADLIEEYLRK